MTNTSMSLDNKNNACYLKSTICLTFISLIFVNGECPPGLKLHRFRNSSTKQCCKVIDCDMGYAPVACFKRIQSKCQRCLDTHFQPKKCTSMDIRCFCQKRESCEPGRELIEEGDITKPNICSTQLPNQHIKGIHDYDVKSEYHLLTTLHPSLIPPPIIQKVISTTSADVDSQNHIWSIVIGLGLGVLIVILVGVSIMCYRHKNSRGIPDNQTKFIQPTQEQCNNHGNDESVPYTLVESSSMLISSSTL